MTTSTCVTHIALLAAYVGHSLLPRCAARMSPFVISGFILNVPLFKIISVVALEMLVRYPLLWVGSLVVAAAVI